MAALKLVQSGQEVFGCPSPPLSGLRTDPERVLELAWATVGQAFDAKASKTAIIRRHTKKAASKLYLREFRLMIAHNNPKSKKSVSSSDNFP